MPSYRRARVVRRNGDPIILLGTILGGVVGLALGYAIAHQINGFDPFHVMPAIQSWLARL